MPLCPLPPLDQVTFENDNPLKDRPVEYASISLDTGTYVGSLYDGVSLLRHGTGTMQFKDGAVYVGQWDMGDMHGTGEMRYADTSSYVGEWSRGHYHGNGRLEMLSAFRCIDVYDGEVRERCDRRAVVAVVRVWRVDRWAMAEGKWRCHVCVQWHHGIMHGYCQRWHWNGAHYIGHYADGKRNGKGRYTATNGDTYDGEVRVACHSCSPSSEVILCPGGDAERAAIVTGAF